MTKLNEDQERIATTINGIVVVDAGPGTGKTHTVVQRYINILDKDVDPSDVLLLTFTNNAAAEMEERVKGEMMLRGKRGDVRSSTFDSFCMKVVMESPETVSDFFGTKEKLTRGAGLVQNETLNKEYFRNVYTRFIRTWGHKYGNVPAVIGTSYEDVYDVIQKLMSIGIAPTKEEEWFGRDISVLIGKKDELLSKLMSVRDKISKTYKEAGNLPPGIVEAADEMISDAVNDKRKDLLAFVRDVYHAFIRSSVSDNRLTFGLNALFAFIVLHENKHVRDLMSFRYVMIDEFQDTNELQFMTSLLILKEANLCVVGDWKQGIYGFRYATIENMTKFEDRMKEMRKFLNKNEKRVIGGDLKVNALQLTRNYRSTQLVIDTAFRALRCKASNNEKIIETGVVTELISERNDHKYTSTERLRARTKEKEISVILQKIVDYVTDPRYKVVEYKKDGTIIERQPEYRDIAVLCRTGKMCVRVKNAADRYNIPAHLQGDINIMETREGKLLLAWLRYINNRTDRRGPVTILAESGYSLSEMHDMFPKDGTGLPDDIVVQTEIFRKKKRRINDLITSIFDHHGLNNDITQSIISVISSAHSNSMVTISELIRMIESDMENESKYNVDALLDGRSVMIQTMHKSKGLEYPIVIIGGLNRSTMPLNDLQTGKRGTPEVVFDPQYGIRMTREYVIHDGHHKIFDCRKWMIIKNAREPDWDGERRLFFVALSRAKQYIAMTCYNGRESSFINDIGGSPLTETETHLTAAAAGIEAKLSEPPVIEGYERRKKRISLHELMGPYEESGDGKGIEHGIRVHKDAQRIMNKLEPYDEYEETERLIEIRNSVKDAKIMTEVDCTYPIKDAVIAGRIDMIAIFDDHVEIHDYKTDMNNRNEERYRIQLSVYGLAARSLKKPVKCIIDYVSQGRSEEIEPVSEEEIYERIVINELK